MRQLKKMRKYIIGCKKMKNNCEKKLKKSNNWKEESEISKIIKIITQKKKKQMKQFSIKGFQLKFKAQQLIKIEKYVP